MKKLAIFFIVLISLVVVAGCQSKQQNEAEPEANAESITAQSSSKSVTVTEKTDESKEKPASVPTINLPEATKEPLPVGPVVDLVAPTPEKLTSVGFESNVMLSLMMASAGGSLWLTKKQKNSL